MNCGNDNPKKKWNYGSENQKKKILTFFSEQGTAKRDHPTTTNSSRHHRPPPPETPSYVKRWSSVDAIHREIESVCAVCEQRKKKE